MQVASWKGATAPPPAGPRRRKATPMPRSARIVWTVMFGLMASLVGVSAPVRAQDSGGKLWATVTNTHPGVGCTVSVSVEIRASGDPVAGLDVGIALFNGRGGVISQDNESTDGNGVAWLAFDTSGLSAGAFDWLDVDLGGAYATGTTIVPSSEDCSDNPKELTASIASLPAPSESSTASADSPSNASSDAASFPTHEQEHSLSCEYASIEIATSYFGNAIPESASLDSVPSAVDPHYGFRGDIDGPFGSTDDYGVYAEALVPVLQAYGFNGSVSYGANASTLETMLNAGQPTLVWIATRGDDGFYDENAYGDRFKLVPWEHVVVAYAYDDTGVWVSDPGNGLLEELSWDWFLPAWSALDGMALAVSPA
jgi:uncharacterized protein YvpB